MKRVATVICLVSLGACGVSGSDPADVTAAHPGNEPADGRGNPPPPAPDLVNGIENEISENFGVFVASSAAGDADGTRAKPFASIAAGLARAKQVGKRVYVCSGTFREAVTIEKAYPMFGGFDCVTWKRAAPRTRIESPTSPALRATDVDQSTLFDGFEVVAPDGSGATPTSIALQATRSPGLIVSNCRIVAGKGQDGARGADGPQLALGPTAAGSPSDPQREGPPSSFKLPLAYRSGSAGGKGECIGAPGFLPENGGDGGYGGTYDSTQQCGDPFKVCAYYYVKTTHQAGAIELPNDPTPGEARTTTPGVAGSDGMSAGSPGRLTVDGFVPASGTAGTNGGTGTGGSGGAGGSLLGAIASHTTQFYAYGATGPGGGAGGCPGVAGSPGQGGGASIGALLIGSGGLTFAVSEIVASAGGAGGEGAFGSNPTPGGAAGAAGGTAQAAAAGAPGGRSGVSGSGAGGSSFAIAHTGGDPKLVSGSRATPGPAGPGVQEMRATDALGNQKVRPASVPGLSKDVYAF